MKLERLVITCGGTGGHFYPGLSIARVFQAQGGQVKLLLSGVNSHRQAQIAEAAGIKALELPRMPSPGRNPLRGMQFLAGFTAGYRRAKSELRAFAPQAMLGMGSFASLPVFLAAYRSGVPRFLHDGNARIGKANRILSRWAEFLATAFPAVNASACKCEVLCTGMPVRHELESRCHIAKSEAIRELNAAFKTDLSAELPTFLVVGGSQGAAIFNQNLPEAMKRFPRADFQVLHLTGPQKFDETRQAYAGANFKVLPVPSTEQMELFFGAADAVFARSGGSTVAELALFEKPAVLVPYPYAAEGHQIDNAHYLADAGAALLVENSQFTVERAQELLQRVLTDSKLRPHPELARPHAAERLLDEIAERLKR